MNDRNDIKLIDPATGKPGHFRLREFENWEGLAMLSPGVLWALERVREKLRAIYAQTVWVIITDSVRTNADIQRLADRLGWIDEGGTVSRDSKHLAKYGGIAVDIIATIASTRKRVPQALLGKICRAHFDWVKDDYANLHVHADNRDGCKAWTEGRVG